MEDAHAKGEQLIVMGDWKSRMSDMDTFFSELGMEEAIREQYDSAPPVTCTWLHSELIDRIYTSSIVVGTQGSYPAFGKLDGDHRGLILDLPDKYNFRFTLQDLVPPSACRLKLDNPAIVKKYNTISWKIFKKTGLNKAIKVIHQNSAYPMKPHVQHQFERINAKVQEAQLRVERKCAHIYAGQVEWSSQVKEAYELVEFWSMAVDTFQAKVINILVGWSIR